MANQELQLVAEPDYSGSSVYAYLQTKTANPDLIKIVELYYSISHELGQRGFGFTRLNPVPFIFQCMHETGFLSSWWLLKNKNLAGIGVTGVTKTGKAEWKPGSVAGTDWAWNEAEQVWKQGLAFSDWPPAVYAHLMHGMAYCNPGQDFTEFAKYFNARYVLALATRRNKPPAKVLADFNGAWAYPGKDYGQRIEAIHTDYLKWLTTATKPAELPAGPPQDILEWIALDLAVEALNKISFYQSEAFYTTIYGKLAALAPAGIISDWPNNTKVQGQFFGLRDELIDRANAIYKAIGQRLPKK